MYTMPLRVERQTTLKWITNIAARDSPRLLPFRSPFQSSNPTTASRRNAHLRISELKSAPQRRTNADQTSPSPPRKNAAMRPRTAHPNSSQPNRIQKLQTGTAPRPNSSPLRLEDIHDESPTTYSGSKEPTPARRPNTADIAGSPLATHSAVQPSVSPVRTRSAQRPQEPYAYRYQPFRGDAIFRYGASSAALQSRARSPTQLDTRDLTAGQPPLGGPTANDKSEGPTAAAAPVARIVDLEALLTQPLASLLPDDLFRRQPNRGGPGPSRCPVTSRRIGSPLPSESPARASTAGDGGPETAAGRPGATTRTARGVDLQRLLTQPLPALLEEARGAAATQGAARRPDLRKGSAWCRVPAWWKAGAAAGSAGQRPQSVAS